MNPKIFLRTMTKIDKELDSYYEALPYSSSNNMASNSLVGTIPSNYMFTTVSSPFDANVDLEEASFNLKWSYELDKNDNLKKTNLIAELVDAIMIKIAHEKCLGKHTSYNIYKRNNFPYVDFIEFTNKFGVGSAKSSSEIPSEDLFFIEDKLTNPNEVKVFMLDSSRKKVFAYKRPLTNPEQKQSVNIETDNLTGFWYLLLLAIASSSLNEKKSDMDIFFKTVLDILKEIAIIVNKFYCDDLPEEFTFATYKIAQNYFTKISDLFNWLLINNQSEYNIKSLFNGIVDNNFPIYNTNMGIPQMFLVGDSDSFSAINNDSFINAVSEAKPNQFKVELHRELSDFEKKMVIKMSPAHVVSKTEITIAKNIHRTWKKENGLRNIMILLEGETGSGKTETARAISSHLGLPYMTLNCSPNMCEDDIKGALMPIVGNETITKATNLSDKDKAMLIEIGKITGSEEEEEKAIEKIICKYNGYSDIVDACTDAVFNSKSAYEKLTGVNKDNAEFADVLAALQCKIHDEFHRLCNLAKSLLSKNDNTITYKFYPSPIVKAFKNGYFLELQEVGNIRDAGVLSSLNDAFDANSCGTIETSIGTVTRHPDFVCCYTTNTHYRGTQELNESVRNRCSLTAKLDTPEEQVLASRIMAKIEVKPSIEKNLIPIIQIVKALDDVSKANSMSGIAGSRALYNFIDAINDGEPFEDAFFTYILYSISTKDEDLEELNRELASLKVLPEYAAILSTVKV